MIPRREKKPYLAVFILFFNTREDLEKTCQTVFKQPKTLLYSFIALVSELLIKLDNYF